MVRTVLLLSGGIDSMVCLSLLLRAQHEVEAIHINYNQAANEFEQEAAVAIAEAFGIPLFVSTMDLTRSFNAGEIPYRNAALIFAAAMAMSHRADEVAIGVHAGVSYPDCSDTFLGAMRKAIQTSSENRLGLIAPLIQWHKHQIIAFALDERLPIQLTYSCEVGAQPPCGKCRSCQDRETLSC